LYFVFTLVFLCTLQAALSAEFSALSVCYTLLHLLYRYFARSQQINDDEDDDDDDDDLGYWQTAKL